MKDTLADWLLSEPVLRVSLSGSGAGVVNWLAPDGVHDGLYPEIGGYYLQFLALAGSSAPGEMADSRCLDAARRVLAWLDEIGPNGDPPTLQQRDMAQSDWRNQCLFVFDLAIILRGMASVEARWPGSVPPELMQRYVASASALAEEGRLASHHLRPGASPDEIPAKWSTQTGVHHVKAAAALAGTGNPLFSGLVAATLSHEAAALDREGAARLRELHPFLYLVEGWLTSWGQSGDADSLERAGRAFMMVMAEFAADACMLPPIAGRRDMPTRADVLAQALRAGLVLEAAGWFDAADAAVWKIIRDALRTALLDRITPEGGIEFDRVNRHRNAWATLFAWQAMGFLAQAETGALEAKSAAARLI